MTTKIFISFIFILTLASCDNTRTQYKPEQETPKALEDKSSSYELVSERGYADLVESLYDEIVNKNVDLKKLEDDIDDLNKSKSDSTASFDKFNKKNQSYFSSANKHAAEINDSLLRDRMKILISNNLIKYTGSITRHSEFLKIIEAKNLTITDLHNVLKIVRTLPLIEKYQRDNLPNTKSLGGYIKRQDETIKYADTLAKK